MIVNHEKTGLDTYVELLHISSKSPDSQPALEATEVDIQGLKCNCNFIKKEATSQVTNDNAGTRAEQSNTN